MVRLRVPRRQRKLNGSLWVGTAIVLLIVWTAIQGPSVAPHDPTERNMVIKGADGQWYLPPFPVFTVPGFPLGTDRFGRDLYSQILFAMRPTIILVLLVAGTRLTAGLVIGLISGWSRSRGARLLENVTNSAATLPALLVALAAIAGAGVSQSMWAFVIGLSLTGWADTAQAVREQTRAVREQTFIEASRALGANHLQIILRHVSRHIMPMVWMLFSFEISATLMATAGLGFLGYYIGGEAFTIVTDTSAARVANTFELGQMLATTAEISIEPWGMLAAGSVVFISVLGFNLLGEGLRNRLLISRMEPNPLLKRIFEPVGFWIEENISPRIEQITSWRFFWPVAATLSVFALAFGGWQWRERLARASEIEDVEIALHNPGGHLWAARRHDAFGTLWTDATGPANPTVAWTFEDESGFSSGPAVAADGTIYLCTNDGTLYALNDDGSVRWEKALEIEPVGTPGLAEDGTIYVVGSEAELTAISRDGEILWQYEQTLKLMGTSGPVVDSNGNIYYTAGGLVQALTPGGEFLWRTVAQYYQVYEEPRLSPNEDLVFLENVTLTADAGTTLDYATRLARNLPRTSQRPILLMDARGRMHLFVGNYSIQWQGDANGALEVIREVIWPAGVFGLGNARNVGATPGGTLWAFFTSTNFTTSSFIWLDLDGRVIGTTRFNYRPAEFLGVDRNSVYYTCGTLGGTNECRAYREGEQEPIWTLSLGIEGRVNGGAIVPGRLYATLQEGALVAMGDGE